MAKLLPAIGREALKGKTMKSFQTAVLALSLLAPVAALALQSSQDPNAPAQNASQLNNEAAHHSAKAENAKEKQKLNKKAEKADKKAAKKESKVEKDQKKAADANAAASGQPQ